MNKSIEIFKEVIRLFNIGESDRSILYIFDKIDDIDDSNILDDIIKLFLGVKLNEDIYVALLASTLVYKESEYRKLYLKYVKDELIKTNNEEVNKILTGL
jgi:hypothetical protein